MKKLLAALLFATSIGAFAQSVTVDLSKLPAEQQKQVQAIAKAQEGEQKLEKVAQVTDSVLTRIEQFGAGAAKGVVGFAKEIGVEANNFAKTPLGMTVMVFTAIHFFGETITDIVIGGIFLFILFPFAAIRLRNCLDNLNWVDVYEVKPVLFGLINRKYLVSRQERKECCSEGAAFEIGVYVVMTIAFMLIGVVHFGL